MVVDGWEVEESRRDGDGTHVCMCVCACVWVCVYLTLLKDSMPPEFSSVVVMRAPVSIRQRLV